MNLLDKPDNEIEALSFKMSSESGRKMEGFLEDYEAAKELATSLTSGQSEGAEIAEEEIITAVKTRIKEKAKEVGYALKEFDDEADPIRTKDDLEAYNASMGDFAGFVYDVLEETGYKIKSIE